MLVKQKHGQDPSHGEQLRECTAARTFSDPVKR